MPDQSFGPEVSAPIVIEKGASSDTTASPSAPLPLTQHADGTLIIDLLPLAAPAVSCNTPEPDPFHPEIVVCAQTSVDPRLGPMIGPAPDDFGTAIPRARVKLSDQAQGELNATNNPIGGWNANGGEVRLKIGF